MPEEKASKYWLDIVTEEIIKKYPQGEIIVESGHSPSGRYHFGLFRELMTAHAVVFALKERGRQARHIDFVDDFDALRKLPEGVNPSFSKYVGWPLFLVPSPRKGSESYADYYLAELYDAVAQTGVETEILKSHQEYKAGKFTELIEHCLSNLDEVKKIIEKVSGRKLEKGWAPVQLLSDNNSLREWVFVSWDKNKKTVQYKDNTGKEGEVSYTDGRVKLDWRLDWPARWSLLGVNVEPFGRDHASAGGSYDSGKALMDKIFNRPAPIPIPYDFILLSGQTKKMSKSAGNIVTLGEILEIMPPELIRYFIARSKPSKQLIFDYVADLYSLTEEFSKVEKAVNDGEEHDFKRAYQVAAAGGVKQTISSVPFSHLVATYQSAVGDFDKIIDLLERTGFEEEVKREKSVLKRELAYIEKWLKKYAPDEVKFEIQEDLPKVELSRGQNQLLIKLAEEIEGQKKLDAQWIHDTIYKLVGELEIKPADAFKAIYRVILDKDSGPRAGWFLASLDKNWLTKRLKLES